MSGCLQSSDSVTHSEDETLLQSCKPAEKTREIKHLQVGGDKRTNIVIYMWLPKNVCMILYTCDFLVMEILLHWCHLVFFAGHLPQAKQAARFVDGRIPRRVGSFGVVRFATHGVSSWSDARDVLTDHDLTTRMRRKKVWKRMFHRFVSAEGAEGFGTLFPHLNLCVSFTVLLISVAF